MKSFLLSILTLSISLAPSVSLAQNLEVATHVLTNGLKLMVHEDPSIPNAALYIFYRVGSRNERPGTTGLSHFFEHMMFNGARKYGPKEFDRVMEAAGGANNAYTSQDLTVYQDWFPVQALPTILELEADRIQHLAFDPKMVESERGVVTSERRTSVDANPYEALSEQLWATAFTAHPYQWPVIGWMTDIEQWSLADLKHHFDMGYSPANATLVLAGAIRFQDFLPLARSSLEPIPPRAPPPPVTTREPEQTGERRINLCQSGQLPILMIGYHVPEATHADHPALRLLEKILLEGRSSRLYHQLITRKPLAVWIQGGFEDTFDPTLFTFTLQPQAKTSPSRLETAFYQVLDDVARHGVTSDEISKARNLLIAQLHRSLETIDGKAHALGRAEVLLGDYRQLFALADHYTQTSAEQVREVARKYFKARNRTVAILTPTADTPSVP